MKTLKVTVDGTVYEVTLESATAGEASAAPAPAPAPSAAPAPSGGGNSINSPLAATIISINVTVGQKINAGDNLITLEAMKMNSYVLAEQSGVVSAILVSPGDQVKEGQPLLSLS